MKRTFLDGVLPAEVYRELLTDIKVAASKPSIFREMFPWMFSAQNISWKQELGYDTMTDVGPGKMDVLFGDLDVDQTTLARSYVKVVKLEKDIRIPRWTLESGSEEGYDYLSQNLISGAKKLGQLENEFLLLGWAEDGSTVQAPFKGLYELANNDYDTTCDFATNGQAVKAVNGAIALLEADYQYGPFKLILNNVQMRELAKSVDNYGKEELPRVNGMLNAPSNGWIGNPDLNTKNIASNPYMTAAKGMMLADNQEAIQIYTGKDINVELYTPDKNEGKYLSCRIFETMALVVSDTDAICKLSSI